MLKRINYQVIRILKEIESKWITSREMRIVVEIRICSAKFLFAFFKEK